MNINWNTELYCLIGDPIEKSLSPEIHNYIFNINNMNCNYMCFNVEDNNLKQVLDTFKILGIKGFNVTIPHKIHIMKYLDDIDEEAKLLGAVNTVKYVNGKLMGYNTDGAGFVKSLVDSGISIKGKKILILGAGGGSHAVSVKLAQSGVKKIIILNRTIEKSKQLAYNISNKFKNIAVEYDDLKSFSKYTDVDIVVNCTSIGMYPDTDEVPIDISIFSNKTVVCDIIYKPIKTKFLKNAEKKNMKIIGGMDMLINQAILSQKIWFSVDKNIAINIDEIKGFLHYSVE